MLTELEAAKVYENQHVATYGGRPLAVFNPQNLAESELPVIYGFNNGGTPGFMGALLLAQDGTELGGHLCSSEAYMPYDLGCLMGSRPDRHEAFKKHYPLGYRMVFVPYDKVQSCEGLRETIARINAD